MKIVLKILLNILNKKEKSNISMILNDLIINKYT